jgi:SAM-dependent methyltransferase
MENWTSGYVADIDYTYGYYRELNPLYARLALLKNGIPCPEINTACELGFGQGLSANIHAAASNCKWYGTDFNPSQAGFAQELAKVSANGAELFDDAFDEFCNRDDLPDFDYIGLHGIWSWISSDNRQTLVDFVKRKLKVGGILYISYNTMPGWAAFAPLRKLMTEHTQVIGAEGAGIVNRIDGAIDFADALLKTNPKYLHANPQIAERVAYLQSQKKEYLAHEYFNKDWAPMPFSEMAESLEFAKLDFAGSANYLSHIDAVNMTEEQNQFLSDIPDLVFRQSVRDFMLNQQFRQDYWVKGARKIPFFDNIDILKAEKVILTTLRPNISLKIDSPLGEANLNEEIHNPILDVLDGHKVVTIGKILEDTKAKNLNLGLIVEAIMTMIHLGHVMSVQQEEANAPAIKSCNKLNLHLMNLARNNAADQQSLASPLTGGGFIVSRLEQIFLLAYINGIKTPEQMADFTWQPLAFKGEKVLKDGIPLETPEENIENLTAKAKEFIEQRLEILKALQIAPKK